jgi:3-deoxy-D-manno-octulosonic-acid transferase
MRAWRTRSSSARSRSSPSSEAEISAARSAGFLGEAALSLYGVAGRLAEPALKPLLKRRETRGKEDSSRRGERFGQAGKPRPAGPLVWVHAASVGETVAVLPLIERLASRDIGLLLTTGTVTAAQVAADRLPPAAIHQFVPVDTPPAVARFLDHWRPDLAVFAESELWPTMLRGLSARGVPLAVVNARMSERSFRTWRAAGPLAKAVVGRAELWLAQSEADAERLLALGAGQVVVSGNLKFDVPPPPADAAAVAGLRADIGERPVFVAASTHPGEEETVIAAHGSVAAQGSRLLTILAPRHPERGPALAADIDAAGLRVGRRSHAEPLTRETDIYLADTIGEMGLWYRLGDMAFLGGSLVSRGGQNPIEPAKLGMPVLHGPHVGNFRDVYQALAEANAVKAVRDESSLASAVETLIADAGERARLASAASACVARFTGALDRTLDMLEPYLARLGATHAASPRA